MAHVPWQSAVVALNSSNWPIMIYIYIYYNELVTITGVRFFRSYWLNCEISSKAGELFEAIEAWPSGKDLDQTISPY